MNIVGQTKNKFYVRWTAHRNNWHKSTGKEEGALFEHYTVKHPAISDSLPLFPSCYISQGDIRGTTSVRIAKTLTVEQCCHSVLNKNPRIHLENKQKIKKKTQTYKMF